MRLATAKTEEGKDGKRFIHGRIAEQPDTMLDVSLGSANMKFISGCLMKVTVRVWAGVAGDFSKDSKEEIREGYILIHDMADMVEAYKRFAAGEVEMCTPKEWIGYAYFHTITMVATGVELGDRVADRLLHEAGGA